MIDNRVRKALMIKAVDGDTVDVEMELLNTGLNIHKFKTRVRLTIIDTPERGQPGYQEATDFTKSFVGLMVNIQVYKEEPHGRIMGDVYVTYEGQEQSLSQLLLMKGLAKVYGE